MSLGTVRTNTGARFNEVQVYLNYLGSEESKVVALLTTPIELNVMKGLFFVLLYGAFEKTLTEAVQRTIILISGKNVQNKHYQFCFNSISLRSSVSSLKDCSYKKVIPNSVDLFEQVGSSDVNVLNETVFTDSLQNTWIKTIEEVRLAFGLGNITLDGRDRAAIDELVDKRNAIAHGRESAGFVGSRYNTVDLRTRMNLVQSFAHELIDDFENYYFDKKYLKPTTRRLYV